MKNIIWLITAASMMYLTGCATGNKSIRPAAEKTAVEYYVDAQSRGGPADDTNPGTREKPWKTFTRAFGDRKPASNYRRV